MLGSVGGFSFFAPIRLVHVHVLTDIIFAENSDENTNALSTLSPQEQQTRTHSMRLAATLVTVSSPC